MVAVDIVLVVMMLVIVITVGVDGGDHADDS